MRYEKKEIKGLGLVAFTQARLMTPNEKIFKLNGLDYLNRAKKHNKTTWLSFVSETFGVNAKRIVENQTNRIEGYTLFDALAAKKGWGRFSEMGRKYPRLRHLLLGGNLSIKKTIDEYSLIFGVPQDVLRDGKFVEWLKSQLQ